MKHNKGVILVNVLFGLLIALVFGIVLATFISSWRYTHGG